MYLKIELCIHIYKLYNNTCDWYIHTVYLLFLLLSILFTIAGEDYVPQVYLVPFSAGETESSFSVEIIDDDILENPPVNSITDLLESFTLNLVLGTTVTDKGIQLGSNSNSEVIIMENDGEMHGFYSLSCSY